MRIIRSIIIAACAIAVVAVSPASAQTKWNLPAAYPTDNLSPGHFSMPQNPEPDQVRSRQLSAMLPRMRWQGGDVVPLAGPAGCVPGVSAVRFASKRANPVTGWHRTTRTAAKGRAICRFAAPSRTHVPGEVHHHNRLGRDCQSPDRSSDKRLAIRSVSSAATAGK